MTSLLFMSFLHLSAVYPLIPGEILEESNPVYTYGLPELTRDILERIKAATGQPINTSHFIPILASSSKGYEIIEHQPYTQSTKYVKKNKNNKVNGGRYHTKTGGKDSGREIDHHREDGGFEESGNELEKHAYEDHDGKKFRYDEESFYKKNYHKSNGGKKGAKSKKERKRGKFHVEKGFRDIYHKDEEKKSDFFWNNQQEEGKWIEYGFKNRKNEKSHDKGDEGKKEKSKMEESSYEKKANKCSKCKTQ